jgi:hypothetical protein
MISMREICIIDPQTELMRQKAMGKVMAAKSEKYRLLLKVFMIIATLGVAYVGYSTRFPAAISQRESSIGTKRWSPTAQNHIPSLQGAVADDTLGRTSVALKNEKTINEKLARRMSNPHGIGIDRSVKGQTFEISTSVKEGCKSDTVECPLVMTSVRRMAEEPRDLDWAAKMEATIQSAFDSQGPDKYVVRNVECRTSICILEVEVHGPGPTIRYEDPIFTSLRPHAMTIGVREYDSSGASYHVELMDFERR